MTMIFTDVLARWMHLLAMAVLVGGMVYNRFVLLPALAVLPEGDRQRLCDQLVGRWRWIVHGMITLLLLTGLYNLVLKIALTTPVWHMLLGLKLILATIILFVASALVGRSQGLQSFRQQASKWLVINTALAMVVVLLSLAMRSVPLKGQVATTATTPTQTVAP